jgi:polysaccharide export outer membrane protein
VAPPDVIRITSKRIREIHGHNEQVSPDGRLTLPLLGPIFVAGRTTEDIAAELRLLASEFYEDADVTVRVIGYNSKKIFVFGEVAAPGAYQYNGANTILATLAKVQPTRLADPENIQVLRPNRDGKLVRRMTISLDKMVKEGDTSLNAVLEEGDIIYVPANLLAKIGLTFQQILLPIQPAASIVAGPEDIDDSVNQGPYRDNGGVQ